MNSKPISLRILNLFGRHMSSYGDAGNLIVLRKRCEWRGISLEQIDCEIDSALAPCEQADLILCGGGQESCISLVQADLLRIAPLLRQLIEDGAPALVVGTGLQVFGEYVENSDGESLEGAGIFSLHTQCGFDRQSGNIVISSSDFGELLGYENHTTKTFLHEGQEPLARVVSGFGNNGEDGTEGARYKNALGTHLHGPLLSKNPRVADYLIAAALERRYNEAVELPPLPDQWVEQARTVARSRPR